MKLFRRLLGYCSCCDRYFVYPKRRRQNTAYMNDKDNFNTLCLRCYDEREEYWQRCWDEYNNERY
ncbi:MAG TPA: hypothetical protein VIK86_04710 [Candidatus Paceibacterota bacterium]